MVFLVKYSNFFKLRNFLVNVCFLGKLYCVIGQWNLLGNFSVFQGKSKVFRETLKFLGNFLGSYEIFKNTEIF